MMSFKHFFYLPSFTSTAMAPEKMILHPFPKDPKPKTGYQNCIFEIDTSSFPNFSTIILPHQTIYDESESLLSCYNIYSWQGFRLNKWIHPQTKEVFYIPVISLKIEDYVSTHDLDKQCIIGPTCAVDEQWIGGKGEAMMNRSITSETLIQNLCTLWDSYDRHYGSQSKSASPYPLIGWLNAPYKIESVTSHMKRFVIPPTEVVLRTEGEILDGVKFEQMVREQDRVRELGKQQGQ